jgi:hypothetical protein
MSSDPYQDVPLGVECAWPTAAMATPPLASVEPVDASIPPDSPQA